ncbi:hypothetical protein FY152_04175 [Agrobacterium tumefaciens]|nr:hypothetical protein FY152_04175 [Agrobacterium tumefaciens]
MAKAREKLLITQSLQLASGLLAFVAAVLWYASSRVKIPKHIAYVDLGRVTGDDDTEDDLDRLMSGLHRQGVLSAYGATAAAAAAFLQGLSLLLTAIC